MREDRSEDADAIIIFLNYLIKIIDKSKSLFTKSDFLKRIFDPDFAESKRYAELLTNEIPAKYRFEVFIDAYEGKERGEGKKLAYFFRALLDKLTDEEKQQAYEIISSELKETNDKIVIRRILQIFPGETWLKYDEVARLRIENILVRDIRDGRYNKIDDKSIGGSFGTWATIICKYFTLKDELVSTITDKLWAWDDTESDYIFKWFFDLLPGIIESPTERLIRTINKGLKNGDRRYYDALNSFIYYSSEPWRKPFIKEFTEFEEKADTVEVDEEPPF